MLVGSLVRGPSLPQLLQVFVAESSQLHTSLGCPWPPSLCTLGSPTSGCGVLVGVSWVEKGHLNRNQKNSEGPVFTSMIEASICDCRTEPHITFSVIVLLSSLTGLSTVLIKQLPRNLSVRISFQGIDLRKWFFFKVPSMPKSFRLWQWTTGNWLELIHLLFFRKNNFLETFARPHRLKRFSDMFTFLKSIKTILIYNKYINMISL